jgi:hypothetical protein
LVIGQNSTDAPCCHDHDVGPRCREITLGLILTCKIKLVTISNEYGTRFLSEATHDCGTGHAGTTGDKHALSRQVKLARY